MLFQDKKNVILTVYSCWLQIFLFNLHFRRRRCFDSTTARSLILEDDDDNNIPCGSDDDHLSDEEYEPIDQFQDGSNADVSSEEDDFEEDDANEASTSAA